MNKGALGIDSCLAANSPWGLPTTGAPGRAQLDVPQHHRWLPLWALILLPDSARCRRGSLSKDRDWCGANSPGSAPSMGIWGSRLCPVHGAAHLEGW